MGGGGGGGEESGGGGGGSGCGYIIMAQDSKVKMVFADS